MNSNKPTTDAFAPHVRPTFLLRWNPEISSMTDEDWARLYRNFPYDPRAGLTTFVKSRVVYCGADFEMNGRSSAVAL